MHPRHAPFYIRRIRISATDAMFKMLKDQGIPYYPEVGQTYENATTFVLEFPDSLGHDVANFLERSTRFKDVGIGPYEYWGSKENDSRMAPVQDVELICEVTEFDTIAYRASGTFTAGGCVCPDDYKGKLS